MMISETQLTIFTISGHPDTVQQLKNNIESLRSKPRLSVNFDELSRVNVQMNHAIEFHYEGYGVRLTIIGEHPGIVTASNILEEYFPEFR